MKSLKNELKFIIFCIESFQSASKCHLHEIEKRKRESLLNHPKGKVDSGFDGFGGSGDFMHPMVLGRTLHQ